MPYYYGFDPYFILVIPALIISLLAQIKVKSSFSKYSRVASRITGAEAARRVLEQNGVFGVTIERVAGELTDHFDPKTNTIHLYDKDMNHIIARTIRKFTSELYKVEKDAGKNITFEQSQSLNAITESDILTKIFTKMFNAYLSRLPLIDVFETIFMYAIIGLLLYFITSRVLFSIYKFIKKNF